MKKNYLDRFLNVHLKTDNRRKNTIYTYTTALNQFYDYFEKTLDIHEEAKLLQSITNTMLEDYRSYLRDEKQYSIATINNRINAWKSFFKYVYDNKDILEKNCAKKLKLLSEDEKEEYDEDEFFNDMKKDILTHDELIKVIESTYVKVGNERMFDFNSARDRFIIALTHTTGLRIEEVLLSKLRWLESISEGYMLRIPSRIVKNKLSKRVPITGKVLQYFNEYMDIRNKVVNKNSDDDLIIISCKGNKFTRQSYNESLKKIMAKNKNIKKHLSSHCGRGYFANELTTSKHESELLIKRIGGWKISDVKNTSYCRDISFDKDKIRACNSLL